MAQDKVRTTKKGVVIQPEEYRSYQAIRRNRLKTIRKAREDMSKSLNLEYSETLIPQRKKERSGKRFTIGDFSSQYDFEQFMKYGDRYLNYDEYKRKRARDYKFHMREAFEKLSGGDPEIMTRFDEVMDELKDPYKLDEIYSNTEELDLSFVYVDTKQGNIARLNTTLDILEKKIKETNDLEA